MDKVEKGNTTGAGQSRSEGHPRSSGSGNPGEEIRFLAFDIDDTLLPSHFESDGFYQMWNRLEFEQSPSLCYNTGRLTDDTLRLVYNKLLPKPHYLICGVGTIIYDVQAGQVIKEFASILEEGWNLDKVSDILSNSKHEILKQPDHYQNDYKSSWYFKNAGKEQIEELRDTLRQEGLDVHVIYSSSLHLDVLPKWANKGNALEWLLKYLDISPQHTIVAGNSGNDSAMYAIDGIRGIVVGNAQPELVKETEKIDVFYTNKLYQDAILEGLEFFGVPFNLNDKGVSHDSINLALVNLMETREITGITPKQQKLIKDGYEHAIEVILKNITPIGFSACSLDDNESTGTDVNYRSVWGRDGSITITGTIPLIDDDRIADCQRKTLETLLNHTSPAGQIPSNVRIDTLNADYSGVGGICSIDSGLWLIIAFYDFVRASGDIDFLRTHIDKLSDVMRWITAHDGNNDSLLEIPEAGDWTDLFGRSYNVLYDEVLWYRANICIGRMFELLGEEKRAADYITWSQVIKNSILREFWPSTTPATPSHRSFDERQFSLGDAQYLIAQVTPFDFSWRCDIYGNVLAHLYNVIDKEKAITTFRFIWGSGVNQPFPVKNVYPVVSAGDPDWRPYYTVNLLNLPNHYHNGGIWPFIGGSWVRYINKLGLQEVALKELYNLAKLNRLGIYNEWEFNEWCHGETGRPMGKAYQAWSASEYILACHDLGLVS
jgi:sucrose-6F-phosphate phosphohydrolase